MGEYITVFVTVPSEELGLDIARTLVENRLAACVNIVPSVRSFYQWQGEVCDDQELLLIIKSQARNFEILRENIVALHSYDTPEVIALAIEKGHEPYLKWIAESTD